MYRSCTTRLRPKLLYTSHSPSKASVQMASIDSLPPSPNTRVSPFGSRQYPADCRGKKGALTGSLTCPPPPAHAPGFGALSTGGGAEPCGVDAPSLLQPTPPREAAAISATMQVRCMTATYGKVGCAATSYLRKRAPR